MAEGRFGLVLDPSSTIFIGSLEPPQTSSSLLVNWDIFTMPPHGFVPKWKLYVLSLTPVSPCSLLICFCLLSSVCRCLVSVCCMPSTETVLPRCREGLWNGWCMKLYRVGRRANPGESVDTPLPRDSPHAEGLLCSAPTLHEMAWKDKRSKGFIWCVCVCAHICVCRWCTCLCACVW